MEKQRFQEILSKLSQADQEFLKNYIENLNPKHVARSMFTEEEDKKLKELVGQYGTENWNQISKLMNGRTVRQCRERYRHYLAPDVQNKEWTEEEDNLLREKYAELGPKWVEINCFFKNRTDINIKNRWVVLLRKESHHIMKPKITQPILDLTSVSEVPYNDLLDQESLHVIDHSSPSLLDIEPWNDKLIE